MNHFLHPFVSPVFRRNLVLGCAVLAMGGGSLRAETVVFTSGQPPYTDPLTSLVEDPLALSISSGSAEQAGVISGAGSVTKVGAGTIALTGLNDYTGDTILSEGTLRLGWGATFGDYETSVLRISAGTTLGNVGTQDAFFSNDSVFAGNFTINVDEEISIGTGPLGEDEVLGSLENFGSVTLLTDTTITLTGDGLACFGGSITGDNLTFLAPEGVAAQVMFCSNTENAISGVVRIGAGVTMELWKVGTVIVGDEEEPVVAISGDLQIDEDAEVILLNGNQFAATSNVEVNGTLTGESSESDTINELTGSGTINSDMGNTLVVNSGDFTGNITGTQVIVKQGEGTLALSGTNSSYTGGTQITNGTLQANSAKALGSGPVSVTGDATLHVASGVALNLGGGKITLANNGTATYRKDFGSGESLADFNVVTSSGANETEAEILAGNAGDDREFVATFDDAPSTPASNDAFRISDVFKLTGTDGDTFVLQLSYTLEAFNAAGLYDNELELVIGLLTNGAWETLGTGETVDGAWTSETTIGQHGVDTTSKTVWVVTDQAGEFSVVPEPSTWLLLGFGMMVVVFLAKRRRA